MESDSETELLGAFGIILCAYVALKIKQKRLRRRFKVRPINRARRASGNFQYYRKMKQWDTPQFFKFTRMIIPVFDKLLEEIRPKMKRESRSDGISAEERLVITLQYLSQGTSIQVLAWTFHVGLTTVHKIIHETCEAIWDTLSPTYLKPPSTEEEWLSIASGFNQRWNFPHCLGAIDGKHINIQAPPRSGSLYFNYKKRFSIVLLASCDSNYRFTSIDIGAYGSQSDGGVLKNSVFGQRLEAGDMGVPEPHRLPNSDVNLPYFLVADEAFPLKPYIMRPYPGKNLTRSQRIFNYRLSRARQVIENTFGLLVARWRILKTTINAKVENVDNIVKAIVVLHNYCQSQFCGHDDNIYCPSGFVDSDDQENGAWRREQTPLRSVGRIGSNIAKRNLYETRNGLADYFMSENGRVIWQDEMIDRGRIMT